VSLYANKQTIKDEIFTTNSRLSVTAKKNIAKHLINCPLPFAIDTITPHGALSAKLDIDLESSALWHVVAETIFYDSKLHLTEKVFKPIVARRPFLLVAAPGNLAYLKSYGFKTFDRWIDESYDFEPDNDLRIDMITRELQKLCSLTPAELDTMYSEMQEVLEYNFAHFYGKFKEIIVNEMVNNLQNCYTQINNGRIPGNDTKWHKRFEMSTNQANTIKHRLVK
jgi:hypothetical protein